MKVHKQGKSIAGRLVRLLVILLFLLCFIRPAGAADQEESVELKIFNEALEIIGKNYMEPVDSKKLLQGAINGMLQSLDPHSAFLTADMFKELEAETRGSFGGIGLEVTEVDDVLTVIAPVEGAPAYKAGIRTGDQIIKIDDKPVKGMSFMEATGKLRGAEGTKVKLTILRKGFTRPRDFTVTRAIINLTSVRSGSLEHNIGYIRISHFQEKTTEELKQAYLDLAKRPEALTGLILDLRNNPGGLLDQALGVSGFFLEQGSRIVSIKGRDASSEKEFKVEAGGQKPAGPIVVLVNEGTASAAEIVTGALQDSGRAVILGTQTFGKGSVQGVVPFEDGSAMTLTIARYYTPKGRSIQAAGITPDIQVEVAAPAEEQEPKKIIREKDLERHIKNEAENGAAPEPAPAKESLDPLKDNQLRAAVEIINGWSILKQAAKR